MIFKLHFILTLVLLSKENVNDLFQSDFVFQVLRYYLKLKKRKRLLQIIIAYK